MVTVSRKFARLGALVVEAATVVIASCTSGGGKGPTAPSTRAEPSADPGQPPVVTIGVANDIPGFNLLVSPETNERSGFDYQLINWLGANSSPGFRPTLAPLTVDERVEALRDGRVGLVVDVLSITPEKKATIGIAGPYMLTRQGILGRRGERSVGSLDDLTDAMQVCTIKGSTSEIRLTPLKEQGRIQLTSVPGVSGCAERLANREVDVISTDQLVLSGVASQRRYAGKFVLSKFTFGTAEEYGIGYPKGNLATCNMLRSGISKLIIDNKWRDFFMSSFPGLNPDSGFKPDPQALDRCE